MRAVVSDCPVKSRFQTAGWFCCAVLLLLCAPFASAQSTGGRIRGTVTDASGAAVVAARVELVNEATHATRDLQTGVNGEYIFVEVPVGTYDLSVTIPGFKKYERKGIALDLNEVVSVDVPLQVGGATETVEVTGAPPVVDTSSTQLGAVVNSLSAEQLPLNQRDVYQLLQLQPGVQSQLGNDLFYGSDKPGVVTVNGGRGRSNNYSVNGGDGNDLFANLPAVEPSPDSIDEFRVLTNTFDAEYGRNSGAVVNVVTKSGTNDIHGSFYEYFRNDVLNAKPFEFQAAPKPDFKQNQFGGTFGGPIKKDKTFFFGAYEGRRIVQGIDSQPVTVPTASELAGNLAVNPGNANPNQFTGTLNDATVANILNNRAGCAAGLTAAGASALAAAAAGTPQPYSTIFASGANPNVSVVPTACFDPVAVALLKYVPGSGGTNSQVTDVANKRDRGDQFQIRLDHQISNSQKLTGYYYFDDDNTLDPYAKFQAAGATLGNFPGDFATRTQQVNISHTWTLGTAAVNEFRFTYFREGQLKFNSPTITNNVTASCGSGAAAAFCFTGTSDTALVTDSGTLLGTSPDYGIHPGLGAQYEGVPFVQINGGFTIGNNYEGQLPQIGNTYQFSDNYSKIIGTHSLKFGVDTRYQMFNQTLYYNVNGYLTFGAGNGNNDLGSSDPYADYFLGLPYNYSQGSAQKELVRSTSLYLFAQDSWKIKPSLTMNYGLRWEMNTPLTDIGHKVQTFRPGENSAIYPCAISPSDPLYATFGSDCLAAGVQPTGLVFPGDQGVPNGLTNTYYKGFAPRIGLNWSPSASDGFVRKITGGPGKTSISTGYGIFYNPIEQLVLEQFSAEPPFGGSNSITNPLLQTPFVDQTGFAYPNPFNGILNPPRGQAIDWSYFRPILLYGQFPKNLNLQYSEQYNLTIKRELPGDMLFQIGYVGSQGHRLLANYELNPGLPQTCNAIAAIAAAAPGDVLTASPVNGGTQTSCSSFGEDSSYYIMPGTTIPAGGLYLPYGPSGPTTLAAGSVVGANGITLVGIRPYSSPNCNPMTGAQCPADSVPVFSGIFTENTIARSNYNSLQVLWEKRYAHGIQFQASYTYSKSLDNASSFENALNPYNFNSTYGPSLFDARHRFVFNYVWDLPVPKMDGFRGKLLDGWQMSGIITYQTGFPIRITSSDDVEEYDATTLFENAGEPNMQGPFKTYNARTGACALGTGPYSGTTNPCVPTPGTVFDPNLFTNSTVTPGTIGNAPRSICCGPGISNTDVSFTKETQISERFQMEFRGDFFNIWNHAQFYTVDGNVSDQGSTFGQVQHIHDPRLVQFALKFRF